MLDLRDHPAVKLAGAVNVARAEDVNGAGILTSLCREVSFSKNPPESAPG